MMKKKLFIITLIAFLASGNFFQYYLSKKQSTRFAEAIHAMERKIGQDEASKDFENFELKNDIQTCLQNDGLEFPTDISVYAPGSKTPVRLSRLIREKTLVVRISQSNCLTCIDAILPLVNQVKSKHILLLADYTNERFLKKVIENHRLAFPCYRIKQLPDLPIERLGAPYLFLMDKDRKMHCVYIPHKEMLEEVEKSLKELGRRLPDFTPGKTAEKSVS